MMEAIEGDPWAGPPTPKERAALLTRALRTYEELDMMIAHALAAPGAEQLRGAVRVVSTCARLDDLLAAAGVAPVRDRRKLTERSAR